MAGLDREERVPQVETLQEQAETCIAEARGHEGAGRGEAILAALRRAVLLYAAADADDHAPEEVGPLTRPRADTCRLFADALATAGRHAEAANIYQEATDLYGQIGGQEAERLAQQCARLLLQSVQALREQPTERLQLLIAHYERIQQQLALEPGTDARQADCFMHIARIYQRRDRPADSVSRYRDALALLDRCESDGEIEMARAECHHRIGNLLAINIHEPAAAIAHYEKAIEIYRAHEPVAFGFQQSLELCRAALARARTALPPLDDGRDREWSLD
jgi:tetratricopeptide (TPR) repeat protein